MTDVLSELNEQQRKVAQMTYGPLLVLAGAGSGKTRALTHRIAYLIHRNIASPHEILAVTFTNKAANEMKQRIGSLLSHSHTLPSAVGTFHGLGAKMLREKSDAHTRSQQFVILDSKDSEKLVRAALKEANVSLREWTPRSMRQRISKAKSNLQTPTDVAAQIESPTDEMFARIFARYEELLTQHDAYDFDDLLRVPYEMLRDNEAIRRTYQARWRFLSVDEYQDTNPLQNRIIDLLLGEEKNLCAVGDDYQAIYSWRGADVDHILRFEDTYPNCTTIYLTQNYRSTPHILNAANKVIAHNEQQKHKKLWTAKRRGAEVQLVTLSSDREEARWVAQRIMDHRREGGRLRDVTILYRTNAQSRLLEEQFLTHRIPYTIVGGFRFYDRREIKDALAFLYFWVNPNSRLSFDRISDALLDRVGPKTIDRWERKAGEAGLSLAALLRNESATRGQLRPLMRAFEKGAEHDGQQVSSLLKTLLTTSGYMEYLQEDPDAEERLENIEELYTVASGYTDVHAFLEDVALLSEVDTMEDQQDRVTCMTLHAAKGLEFPMVFIIGAEEGLLPHINSVDDTSSMEEERRLLYVGMTRAQRQLTISYATHRYIAGEMTPQLASRFLDHLPESVERVNLAHAVTPPGSSINDESDGFFDGESDIASLLHTADNDEQDAASEPVAIATSEGEFVHHPTFGRGVVISINGSMVTCVFEQHGVKTIDGQALETQ